MFCPWAWSFKLTTYFYRPKDWTVKRRVLCVCVCMCFVKFHLSWLAVLVTWTAACWTAPNVNIDVTCPKAFKIEANLYCLSLCSVFTFISFTGTAPLTICSRNGTRVKWDHERGVEYVDTRSDCWSCLSNIYIFPKSLDNFQMSNAAGGNYLLETLYTSEGE